MLTSIKVTGYRAFQSLEAKDLGRVNLIVGKNNAGKTSLLEAICLSLNNMLPLCIRGILVRRGEIDAPVLDNEFKTTEYPIHTLFTGHQLHQGARFETTRTDVNGNHITATCSVTRYAQNESGEIEINIQTADKTVVFPLFFHNGKIIIDSTNLLDDPCIELLSFATHCRFVPNTSLSPKQMVGCWEKIDMSPEESFLYQLLQIIDPQIQRINFYPNTTTPFHIRVLHDTFGKIPLSSMGDGIYKLLALSLALVDAKSACILIDEIDTGLHYSVMQKMWEMVIETAKRLDIQIFATTHSLDCIRALAWLQEEKPEICGEVRLHQIRKDKPQTTVFDAEDIRLAVDSLSELR